MSRQECRACVVFCMDYRLHDQLAAFLKEERLDWEKADVIRVAGAAKNLARPKEPRDREFLLEQLRTAYALHHARQVYIVNHEDCGAYGPEEIPDTAEELQVHRADLLAAADLVRERFADVEVIPCFMWLTGRTERVTE